MKTKSNTPETKTSADETEVLITRTFNAPRATVFKAWTDPQQLIRWYAPNGCRISYKYNHPELHGTFLSCIHTPDGKDCWCKGEYKEFVKNERLAFTMVVSNEKGESVSPTSVGMDPTWPTETLVTVTFEDVAGKTKLVLKQTVSEELAKRTGAHPSWLQMFDRLEQMIAGESNS